MMINKKQLAIGFSLVLLSGLAAVSGTFAWFGTNRTAQITFTDATIRGRSGNLNVTYVKSFNTMLASESVDTFGDAKIDLTIDRTVEEAKYVTDISGDGLEFFKTSWSGVKNTNNTRLDGISQYKAGEINEIEIEKAGDADGFFIDFTLKISRDNKDSDHGLLVYLGEGTRILPKVEDLSSYSDTVDGDGNVVKKAYDKYFEQQLKNINATRSARLAVNDLDDYPVTEVEPGEPPYVPTPTTKFVYAQEREIYTPTPMPPGQRQDGEYMYIAAERDANGDLVAGGHSAYGFDGAFELRDLEEVRDGFVHELGVNDDAEGKVITLLGDTSLGTPDVRYDFVSGFKSYVNHSQITEVVKDSNGDALPAWKQPYNHGLIADLNTNNNTVEYVNFRMWIEGSDVEAQSDVIGGVFTLELDIYTVEVLKD